MSRKTPGTAAVAFASLLALGVTSCGPAPAPVAGGATTGSVPPPPDPQSVAAATDPLDDFEARVAAAIGQTRESAVALEYSADGAAKGARRVASGVVISDDGDVLSVRVDAPPSASPIVARVASGRLLPARWVAGDPETGLTLLQIAPGSARPARVSPRDATLGMPVILIGNPFGLAHSVGRGFVAGLNRRIYLDPRPLGGLIQVDAAFHPGDSGALLADLRGGWLGVVRSGLAPPADRAPVEKGAGADSDGSGNKKDRHKDKDKDRDRDGRSREYDHDLGFAIPARDALWVAGQLRDRGRVERAYLGVTMDPSTTTAYPSPLTAFSGEIEGAVLRGVLPETPAGRAGLKPGDRVVSLDGRPVRCGSDLTDQLDWTLADSEVTVEFVRGSGPDREQRRLALRTARRPAFEPQEPPKPEKKASGRRVEVSESREKP